MKLFIDEWTGITTPNGEKINIHFETNEDDDSKIDVYFYDVHTFANGDVQNGDNQFEVLSLTTTKTE